MTVVTDAVETLALPKETPQLPYIPMPLLPPRTPTAESSWMTHFFPLRQSTQIELSLPLDLTDREARRFAQFVESLAVDDVFPADERDDPWPTYLFPMRRDLYCELDFPPDLT